MRINIPRVADATIGVAITLAVCVGVAGYFVATRSVHESEPNAIAAKFNLEIVWFDDESPCGDSTDIAGCYTPDTPNVIYVNSGLDPEVERYAILHEIGHATQDRLGLPLDECDADQFAASLGATGLVYDC